MESKDKSVGDYVSLVRGITYKGSLVGEPGPALLGLGSIHPGGGFREGDYKTYGGECPEKLMLFPGDLFVSLKGATKDSEMIGSVARVPVSVKSGRLTQDTVKLVFNEQDRSIANYLYWLLRTPSYRQYCAGRARGSAVVALSREDFLSYPVPPLNSTRMQLVSLFEAIEQKVELNRRISETLKAMGRALFKSWFVDFDPVRAKAEGRWRKGESLPGLPAHLYDLFPASFENSELGEIPKGWRVVALSEIAENVGESVRPAEIASDTPYIALEHMPRGQIALNEWQDAAGVESNKFKFKVGDILFGKLRPYFHKVGVAPLDGVCSTDILVLRPKSPEFFSFFWDTRQAMNWLHLRLQVPRGQRCHVRAGRNSLNIRLSALPLRSSNTSTIEYGGWSIEF